MRAANLGGRMTKQELKKIWDWLATKPIVGDARSTMITLLLEVEELQERAEGKHESSSLYRT